MGYYNRMTPFPVYDTDYVKKVSETVDTLEKEDVDYDDEPVVACKYCKSLHITTEVEGQEDYDLCNRCYTVNELIEFDNINEYNKYLEKEGHPVYIK